MPLNGSSIVWWFWKVDRFGRSVLHLNQQLAALSSYGVRFIATSQSLDTDQSNPTSRLLLQILASVAKFEREMIRERTLVGLRVAKANGKHVGRPKRVFGRDELVRLREECQHRNKTTAFPPVVLLGERAISGDAVRTL
jgi:DNA invertase Pin-like site-specific DNA recombinase